MISYNANNHKTHIILYQGNKKWTMFSMCFLQFPAVLTSFDHFVIWLLGSSITFICLYIPRVHYFISTLWPWSTDNCVKKVLSQSPSLRENQRSKSCHILTCTPLLTCTCILAVHIAVASSYYHINQLYAILA